ncbi:PAS domain S-box protein [Peribacillus muralis]|uniref:PAS domain-containing sensor histidine kinase n=1 Tax=Peribacillus muralis TaxID=264697 RepID=UPI001F4E5A17|nr:PAS domain-containing sensor histidine kinase [Peribacillus muralis]MCK1994132.1 PAS domain S-box protein [Peribacillus muralis]MCK2014687.1 PAS domain S-box protein [Peribacillus muralis]
MSKRSILSIYILCGIVILVVFDYFLTTNIQNKEVFIQLQRAEGIFFLLSIGLILYLYLAKRAEFKQLKEAEQRRRTLINSMVDFVNFKDGDGRWLESNTFGLKLFQLEHVDYKGKRDSELAEYTEFYKESLIYCEASDEETWIQGEITRCEEIIPLPDGNHKTFDTIKVPLFFEDGSRKGLVVIGRDISERVAAEKQLFDSEQRYKSLFEHNPYPMLMLDLHGMITTVNPRFETVTGFQQEEIRGSSFVKLDFSPEDADLIRTSCEYVVENRKGIKKGRDIQFLTKYGKSILLSCTFVPMMIGDELVGIITYAKEVTQIRETEARLRRSEKLSIVGELAASVAHEVRNPLTSLKGFVQLLKKSDHPHEQYYSIMLSELDRINLIVSELLVLAKPQELPFSKQQIVQLMNEVKILLKPETDSFSTQITITVKNEIPLLSCEGNQLKQVFINMFKNSMEAAADKIWIEFEQMDKNLSIIIKDNGSGIEKKRLKHLGEPFYSSKERGTGLGLTVSCRIIEAHGGKVRFNSELNRGTEVEIILPNKA